MIIALLIIIIMCLLCPRLVVGLAVIGAGLFLASVAVTIVVAAFAP